jgi:4-alpha-glucanotransferase
MGNRKKLRPSKKNIVGSSQSRSAGILLPITSLASAFGIGDLGPEGKKFVDFLRRAKQTYWQILPLNPVSEQQAFSPYSSVSSFAGNTLLISPELLSAEGWLSKKELKGYIVEPTGSVNYNNAVHSRKNLLSVAYGNFKKSKLQRAFKNFCMQESYWLDDFAHYVILKEQHSHKPWYDWPKEYRSHNKIALKKFSEDFYEPIRYVKWQQFIFFQQWFALKRYANGLGIKMFGDLPFYVSHDSADVWSHPDIFSVDKKGNMEKIAGVPPDYFNKNGQLWGMPVFKWDVLEKSNYNWWFQRLRKNLELFDLLRLDHFRAFASYWEVSANEKTAIRGKWKPGPGLPFFQFLKERLGTLPFVAEDLGDINEAVHTLREHFNLPGMKVLQFAFSDSMPQSDYIPHNYRDDFFVYTGTHDNNTTCGWFRQNATKKEKEHISKYVGRTVDEKNVHLELSRMAYSSVAKTVILPIQDVLGLDENARINTPATMKDNWSWRLKTDTLTLHAAEQLSEWSTLFNRQ